MNNETESGEGYTGGEQHAKVGERVWSCHTWDESFFAEEMDDGDCPWCGEELADETPEGWRPARKRPVEIEFRGPFYETDEIETIEGDFEVDEEYLEEHGGYVIIRGVNGEKYPCALDIFTETYEVIG